MYFALVTVAIEWLPVRKYGRKVRRKDRFVS